MPVRVGVVGEGDAVLILQADQPGHRIGAGAVHADLAVVIDRHERERRIDLRVHHLDVQAVDFVDRLPVVHRRAAERVHAQLQAGGADRVHVDDVPQVVDIGQDEIFLVRGRCLERRGERHALHARHCRPAAARWPGPATQLVTSVSAGPPLVGLYLKPPSSGGLCDGVMTMPSARCSLRPRL